MEYTLFKSGKKRGRKTVQLFRGDKSGRARTLFVYRLGGRAKHVLSVKGKILVLNTGRGKKGLMYTHTGSSKGSGD